MLFNNHIFTAATLFSTLAVALPLEGRDIVPRNKSYDVVNVGGGSQTPETTVVQATKTVEVVNPGPTVEVTTTIAAPAAPAPTGSTSAFSSSTSSAASSSATPSSCPASKSSTKSSSTTIAPSSTKSTAIETIYVTVPVPDDGPYYDDGMWHTKYRVKTFEAAALATPAAVASS